MPAPPAHLTLAAAAAAALAAVLLVASEWLFHVTKPSFLDSFPFEQVLAAPLLVAVALAVPCALLCLALGLLGPRWAAAVPALLATATCWLLLDNASYTLFGFWSLDPALWIRLLYGLVLVGMVMAWYRWFLAHVERCAAGYRRWAPGGAALLVVAAGVGVGLGGGQGAGMAPARITSGGPLPHVVIVSSDGINARHTSAWGYKQDTTPFLSTLLDDSIVAENTFTNSAKTTGALGALLSGKPPLATGVMFRPDVFRGRDTVQHLPGLLAQLGYEGHDVSVRWYADAADLNLRQGFHVGNGRRLRGTATLANLLGRLLPAAGLLAEQIGERLRSRVWHVSFIETWSNPFTEVAQLATTIYEEDDQRMALAMAAIDGSDGPLFLHMHLLGTHGPIFQPRNRVFSADRPAPGRHFELYLDSIRDFDDRLRSIVEALQARGMWQDTLLVVHSDHGKGWTNQERLPLLVRLPGGSLSRRIQTNVQHTDVAPTILTALGQPVPEWMVGTPLQVLPASAERRVFSVDRTKTVKEDGKREIASYEPPWYSLGVLTMIECNNIYLVKVPSYAYSRDRAKGHTGCSQPFRSKASALAALYEELARHGYPVPGDDQ